MKPFIFLATIILCLCSCRHSTAPANDPESLKATFTITDTSGHPAAQFHSGEPFDLYFSVTNTTKDTLTYITPWPFTPSFHILENDSNVTDPYFGCPVPIFEFYPFGKGHLSPGQTLENRWKAPTPLCRNSMLVLAPGSYQATCSYPTFDPVKIDTVLPIAFTIVP